jgi:hypothetical protein
MFIGRSSRGNQLRSQERNGVGVAKLTLTSAPANGAGGDSYSSTYKHDTPHGVKPLAASKRKTLEQSAWQDYVRPAYNARALTAPFAERRKDLTPCHSSQSTGLIFVRNVAKR